MSFKKGDIVLVSFPFTDLTQTKLRPAVVLWVSFTGGNNVTLCLISSQNLNKLQPEEFLIRESDSEFYETGLKITSKVIVSRIVTIQRTLIKRKLGSLGMNQKEQLDAFLRQTFQL